MMFRAAPIGKNKAFSGLNKKAIFEKPILQNINVDYKKLYNGEVHSCYPRLFFQQTYHVLKKLQNIWLDFQSLDYNTLVKEISLFSEHFYANTEMPAQYFIDTKQTLEDLYFYLIEQNIPHEKRLAAFNVFLKELTESRQKYPMTVASEESKEVEEKKENSAEPKEAQAKQYVLSDTYKDEPKTLKRDYQNLYHDDEAVSLYLSKNSDKAEAEVATSFNEFTIKDAQLRIAFQEQTIYLLNRLNQWGLDQLQSQLDAKQISEDTHRKDHDSMNVWFMHLAQNLFQMSYSGGQLPAYFEKLKKNWETFYFYLLEETIAPKLIAKKWQLFKDFYHNFGYCSPALFSYSQDTLYRATKTVSIENWLCDLRGSIIDRYSQLFIRANTIADGNQIHVYNAFYTYAMHEGFNPPWNMKDNIDSFTKYVAIHPNDLIHFHQFFETEYNADAIFKCLLTNITSEINTLISDLKIERHGECFAYSKTLMDKVDHLLTEIGFAKDSTALLLKMDPDTGLMRLHLDTFSLYLINNNPKLFSEKVSKIVLNANESLVLFNDQVICVEQLDDSLPLSPVTSLDKRALNKFRHAPGILNKLIVLTDNSQDLKLSVYEVDDLIRLLEYDFFKVVKDFDQFHKLSQHIALHKFQKIFKNVTQKIYDKYFLNAVNKPHIVGDKFQTLLKLLSLPKFLKIYTQNPLDDVDRFLVNQIIENAAIKQIFYGTYTFRVPDFQLQLALLKKYQINFSYVSLRDFISLHVNGSLSPEAISTFEPYASILVGSIRDLFDIFICLSFFDFIKDEKIPTCYFNQKINLSKLAERLNFNKAQMEKGIRRLHSLNVLASLIESFSDLKLIPADIRATLLNSESQLLKTLLTDRKTVLQGLKLLGEEICELIPQDSELLHDDNVTGIFKQTNLEERTLLVNIFVKHERLMNCIANFNDLIIILPLHDKPREFISNHKEKILSFIETPAQLVEIIVTSGELIFEIMSSGEVTRLLQQLKKSDLACLKDYGTTKREEALMLLKHKNLLQYLTGDSESLYLIHNVLGKLLNFKEFISKHDDVLMTLLNDYTLSENIMHFPMEIRDVLLQGFEQRAQTWRHIFQIYLCFPDYSDVHTLTKQLPSTQMRISALCDGLVWVVPYLTANANKTFLKTFKREINSLVNNAADLKKLLLSLRFLQNFTLTEVIGERVKKLVSFKDLAMFDKNQGTSSSVSVTLEKLCKEYKSETKNTHQLFKHKNQAAMNKATKMAGWKKK